MQYKMQRVNWASRPRLGRWRKKRSRMVVVQGGVVQGFSAVVCAASLAIMRVRARRL